MPNFYNTRATGQQLDQLPDVIEKVNRIDQEVSRQKEDIADLQESISGGSGGGVSAEFIIALQELFAGVAIWDSSKISNPSQKIAELKKYISAEPIPPTEEPDEPEEPTDEEKPVSVSYSGTTAIARNLKTLNVSYDGTTATIGA